MEINGIDLDGLAHDASLIEVPEPVQGRVVHIDADFLAYQCSAERADGTDMKTWDDMKHNAKIAVSTLKELAGATAVHLHLTPATSDKGKRWEISQLKEYQANREGKEKPRYLNIMREHLAKEYPGTLHQNCEADDGMASSQYSALARGEEHLSIIASKDKDLRMVPGLHLDWDAGSIHATGDSFGSIELSATAGGTTKLIGYGQKFFWAQMLMGDSADNISGLPKCVGTILNNVKPTGEINKASLDLLNHAAGTPKHTKALATLNERKPASVGPALAFLLLDEVTSNKQAFEYVKMLYRMYGEQIGFKEWRTEQELPWNKAFLSEAQLLWMRRNRADELDVIRWFKEIAV